MTNFKVGQVLREICGCTWKVVKVTRKYYHLQHTSDKDILPTPKDYVHREMKIL